MDPQYVEGLFRSTKHNFIFGNIYLCLYGAKARAVMVYTGTYRTGQRLFYDLVKSDTNKNCFFKKNALTLKFEKEDKKNHCTGTYATSTPDDEGILENVIESGPDLEKEFTQENGWCKIV